MTQSPLVDWRAICGGTGVLMSIQMSAVWISSASRYNMLQSWINTTYSIFAEIMLTDHIQIAKCGHLAKMTECL
jgi:hypothetical protein